METSTKEITAKRYRKKVKEFIPIAEYLRAEGKTDGDIWQIFKSYVHYGITGHYYKDPVHPITDSIKQFLVEYPTSFDGVGLEFETKLLELEPEYQVGYKIGKYRVEYLIIDWLIVEIDGDQDQARLQYFRDFGYKVLNVPKWLLEMSVDAVIEEIRDLIS